MHIQELINKLTLLGESEKIEAKTGQELGKSIHEDDLLVLLQGRETESYDYTVVFDAKSSDIDPEAIEDYRKERTLVHPQAKELLWTDEQLLLSLGCLKNHRGELKPTVAGILLFGTAFALRRLFPLARIDYIRKQR